MKNSKLVCGSCGGFTLIELMIVVAVVGILATVAYPSYQQYVRKGHRADVQAFMMSLAQLEQQYFTDNRSYGDLAALGVSVPSTISPTYYTVTSQPSNSATPPCFTITATAQGSQAVDGDLTLTCTGAKSPSNKW